MFNLKDAGYLGQGIMGICWNLFMILLAVFGIFCFIIPILSIFI